jgi:putative hemolysin
LDQTGLEIGIIAFLILLNGLFAIAELSIVGARKGRLSQLADEGSRDAMDALELGKSTGPLVPTLQIGITFTSTVIGALAGFFFTPPLSILLEKILLIAPYSRLIAFILVTLNVTGALLVFGELVPKRLALNNPDGLALVLAPWMRWLSRIFAPLVHFLGFLTNLILKILRVSANEETPVTQEEIKILMEQATQEGVFEESEQDMVEGVLRLGDRYVNAIMTPRTEIVWLDLDDPFEDNLKLIRLADYAFFPIGKGSLDNVLGVIETRTFLASCLERMPDDLLPFIQKPLFIPETMMALEALEMIKSQGAPVGLVIDEYGGLLGMVTLFDILESIVGAIPDKGDPVKEDVAIRADGSWLLDGMLRVDELKEFLRQDSLPEEGRIGYQTLGGLILSQVGSIPTPGQFFEWNNLHFEVVEMDGRRVGKVLIRPVKTEPVQTEESI